MKLKEGKKRKMAVDRPTTDLLLVGNHSEQNLYAVEGQDLQVDVVDGPDDRVVRQGDLAQRYGHVAQSLVVQDRFFLGTLESLATLCVVRSICERARVANLEHNLETVEVDHLQIFGNSVLFPCACERAVSK